MLKKILQALGLAIVAVIVAVGWHVLVDYRFETITPGKVYKSAAMPPAKLVDYLHQYHIRTVIDLREPGEHDLPDPTLPSEIQAEDAAVTAAGARHVSIPSDQVPTAATLSRFFAVLDDEHAYPVLIHCHDGTGRAVIYSAIYRLEYEGWSDAAARDKTRLVVDFLGYHSAFADGKPKGDFLMHYSPRKDGAESTFSRLSAGSNP